MLHALIGEVAQRRSLEPSAITLLVKRLSTAGFVDSAPDPADERHVRVTLTDRGRPLVSDSRRLAEEGFAEPGLTVAQIAALTERVQALRRVLAASARRS